MTQYMTVKTSMGRKYRMRMHRREAPERILYWTMLVTLPFVGAAGMFLLWVKMG